MKPEEVKECLAEKSKIFCPCCGKKKVYWLDGAEDYTHWCKNCEEVFTCKHSTKII